MFDKLPSHTNLDEWLTHLDQPDLEHIYRDANQPDGVTAHIAILTLHFAGHALDIPTLLDKQQRLGICIMMEVLRRRGRVIKEGQYSIADNGEQFKFSMARLS